MVASEEDLLIGFRVFGGLQARLHASGNIFLSGVGQAST